MTDENTEETQDEITPEAEAAATPESPDAESPAEPVAAEPANTSEPAAESPSEPVAEDPAEPVAEDPAEPVAEEPAAETGPELTIGSDAPSEPAPEESRAPVIRGQVDRFGVAMGTGRRKTSVARVRVRAGNGQLTINGRAVEDYCRIERDRLLIEAPLRVTGTFGKVDVWVRVQGGGTTGQAGAIVLGIARALQVMDPSLHHALSEGGYLTRDGRMVERKKYGYKKARKSFQFSKR